MAVVEEKGMRQARVLVLGKAEKVVLVSSPSSIATPEPST
jgi:hypothetical protein